MSLKIAVTGNIASGKSQVEQYLIQKGYIVYDTDVIAHELLDSVREFDNYDVFTEGKIDRKKLGELVFNNKSVKNKLEQILHPKIKERIIELFELHKNDKYIFVSVPLLYETGFESLFDKVLIITADRKLQTERLMRRNNYSFEQAESRINSQLSQDEKIKMADYVISNNSTKAHLYEQIDSFLKLLS